MTAQRQRSCSTTDGFAGALSALRWFAAFGALSLFWILALSQIASWGGFRNETQRDCIEQSLAGTAIVAPISPVAPCGDVSRWIEGPLHCPDNLCAQLHVWLDFAFMVTMALTLTAGLRLARRVLCWKGYVGPWWAYSMAASRWALRSFIVLWLLMDVGENLYLAMVLDSWHAYVEVELELQILTAAKFRFAAVAVGIIAAWLTAVAVVTAPAWFRLGVKTLARLWRLIS